MSSSHAERISKTQHALGDQGLSAVVIPSSDPHLSEYLPERWQGRRWLSGFTGSMGTLVVTRERAAVFADSRYWVQAEAELKGSGIELVKVATGTADDHIGWLAELLPAGETVGVDGDVLGLAAARALRDGLSEGGVSLRSDVDILGTVWPERPSLPRESVYPHTAPHADMTRGQKLAAVRSSMECFGATHHFVSTVDDVSWLLNLRGNDVNYNPVFLAHLLVKADGATLFIGEGKVDDELRAALAADGVELADYDQARAQLKGLDSSAVLLIDPKRVTLGFVSESLEARIVESINPSTLFKSRKSAAEAAHVRAVMDQDGAAMCNFYAWFEAAVGKETITEITVDERLSAERAKRPGFVGLSFGTIAAFKGNGAMPHYRALPESHATIEGDGLLLIDSGGQYLGGTTDITRVWGIGQVTEEQRRDYTYVLKGTMALSRTRFPRGTMSPSLDSIARAPLWNAGIEYGHGTGHGVGFFLNVHEGPQTISKAMPNKHMGMEPGMITSIEPGVYRPGRWGVRIENLVLNIPSTETEFGEFLEFETLTMCPIDTRLIQPGLLRQDEIDWLNDYHTTVRERLSPLVSGPALAWLEERTQPI
ncbi:MAG: Xaa-Pro aminopeptidase [Planctomycetota bacterium]|jgi:Xaa-Pro aminopeptidase